MVADPPVPLPTTPLRASRSEDWIGRSGRTLGCAADPARRTSRALERSSSNSSSIWVAKLISSATRSISQLATRLLKFRLVEPTVDHQGLGVDHGAAVLEDADTRLKELPVARAGERPDPGQIVGRRHENPHVHTVTGHGHQGLGEDRYREEVSVGDPEPALDSCGEQLQHTQGPHPAWFLDDYARRLFAGL